MSSGARLRFRRRYRSQCAPWSASIPIIRDTMTMVRVTKTVNCVESRMFKHLPRKIKK